MSFFSFDEIADIPVGSDTGNLGKNLAVAARDAYCQVWRDDPLSVKAFPDPTGTGALVQGLNDSFCRALPPSPSPPPRQPSGGQCPTAYRVELVWSGTDIISGEVVPRNGVAGGGSAAGPIRTYRTEYDDVAGNKSASLWVTDDSGAEALYATTPSLNGTLGNYSARFTRIDGLPDSCGDPPPPPTPDPRPQPSPIVVWPTINVPGPGSGQITLPVTLRPSWTFAPEINIQTGPINVNVDFTGVRLQPNFNFNPDFVFPSPTLPPGVPEAPRLPPGGGGAPPGQTAPGGECPDPCPEPIDYTAILNRIEDDTEEIIDLLTPPQYADFFTNLAVGVDSGTFVLVGDIKQTVIVTVNDPTPFTRVQSGNDEAPDVYFIGWYAFGFGSGLGDRHPLSYATNEIPVPDRAVTFSFTLKDGNIGTCAYRYQMEIVEP